MPIHAKKEKPIEVNVSPHLGIRPNKVEKATPEKFVPPEPRCDECFYWRPIAECSNCMRCCHHLLRTGKRRDAISETECGSYLNREEAPKERFMFTDVPITQWGCPEVVDWKTQR